MGAGSPGDSAEIVHRVTCSTARRSRRLSARAGERRWLYYLEFVRSRASERWPIPGNENLRPQTRSRGHASLFRVDHRARELMLRSALLYLSSQQQIFKFVRHNKLAKSFANRFVAGETLDTALSAV